MIPARTHIGVDVGVGLLCQPTLVFGVGAQLFLTLPVRGRKLIRVESGFAGSPRRSAAMQNYPNPLAGQNGARRLVS